MIFFVVRETVGMLLGLVGSAVTLAVSGFFVVHLLGFVADLMSPHK